MHKNGEQYQTKCLKSSPKKRIIEWLPPGTSTNSQPIPLTIAYAHKQDGQTTILKPQCANSGDVMIPHIHYDPVCVATPMESKNYVCLLNLLAASYYLHMEKFDIMAAYVHENHDYDKLYLSENLLRQMALAYMVKPSVASPKTYTGCPVADNCSP